MIGEEAHARWICCPMCDKEKCEREADDDDCDVKIYLKNKAEEELNDVRQELLNRPDQYITFKDLVERFDEIDAEYNHSPWNLLQIYSNFNILIGTEREDKQMNKLEKAKEIVKANYKYACCGIFDCQNIVGDPMSTLYEDEDLTIDICYSYMYFEVFGLSEEEFGELEKYYNSLRESEDKK